MHLWARDGRFNYSKSMHSTYYARAWLLQIETVQKLLEMSNTCCCKTSGDLTTQAHFNEREKMGKVICISEMVDAPVDPKKAASFQLYLATLVCAIRDWIERGLRILVVCNHGQNRSAIVCVLAHKRLVRCSFNESLQRLQEEAEEARSKGQQVPTRSFSLHWF